MSPLLLLLHTALHKRTETIWRQTHIFLLTFPVRSLCLSHTVDLCSGIKMMKRTLLIKHSSRFFLSFYSQHGRVWRNACFCWRAGVNVRCVRCLHSFPPAWLHVASEMLPECICVSATAAYCFLKTACRLMCVSMYPCMCVCVCVCVYVCVHEVDVRDYSHRETVSLSCVSLGKPA